MGPCVTSILYADPDVMVMAGGRAEHRFFSRPHSGRHAAIAFRYSHLGSFETSSGSQVDYRRIRVHAVLGIVREGFVGKVGFELSLKVWVRVRSGDKMWGYISCIWVSR